MKILNFSAQWRTKWSRFWNLCLLLLMLKQVPFIFASRQEGQNMIRISDNITG